jgi:hypothetical protein
MTTVTKEQSAVLAAFEDIQDIITEFNEEQIALNAKFQCEMSFEENEDGWRIVITAKPCVGDHGEDLSEDQILAFSRSYILIIAKDISDVLRGLKLAYGPLGIFKRLYVSCVRHNDFIDLISMFINTEAAAAQGEKKRQLAASKPTPYP